MVLVLLSALVERVSVSRMWNFLFINLSCHNFNLAQKEDCQKFSFFREAYTKKSGLTMEFFRKRWGV